MQNEDKKYILYIRNACSFCVKARELLAIYEAEYQVIALDDSPSVLQEMKEAWKWPTVPMVFQYSGEDPIGTVKFIGGYTDLRTQLDIDG
jgi:glutaredoxin